MNRQCEKPQPAEGLVRADELPSTFRNYDLNAAILDTEALFQMAGAVADAWLAVMSHGTESVHFRDRMGALVWLQVDLCEALRWKIAQLDETHRLVPRGGQENPVPPDVMERAKELLLHAAVGEKSSVES